MNLERDSQLGKYVIRERIGVGGMGAVYRAYDTFLKRHVAIKTILDDKVADREYLMRFEREATAASRISDHHIVRLYDFVQGDLSRNEPPYMVMELLSGESLQAVIARGPVPVEWICSILLQVCSAVNKCHKARIVHRDLKGTNIFLTKYNSADVAKILDFGVAKVWASAAIAQAGDSADVTRKGIALGTPAYLAPELLRGGPASASTDQYALGVLLYSALTGGRKPFEAQEKGELRDLDLMRAILKGEHLPVRARRADVPEGLEAVIERTIALDAGQRYPTVHDLGEALLPWASEKARVQWTEHYTNKSAPDEPVDPHQSMVVPARPPAAAEAGNTEPDPKRASSPNSSVTRQVESRELRQLLHEESSLADAREGAPTARDAKLPSSISLEIDEAEEPGVPAARSARARDEHVVIALPRPLVPAPSAPPSRTSARSEAPNPTAPARSRGPILLLGAVFVCALALGAALVQRGVIRVPGADTATAASPGAGPATTTAAARMPLSPSAPPNQASAPPPVVPGPPPAAAPIADEAPRASSPSAGSEKPKKRSASKRRHPELQVDENGIPIPAN